MPRSKTQTRSASTKSTTLSAASWTSWPRGAKLRLLARLLAEKWRQQARPEQLPPDGGWRVWYLRGGRGAGKTRTGAETLAGWILADLDAGPLDGNWAVVAPTYGDARDTCVEGPSGLINALGGRGGPFVQDWNRSMGELKLWNGAIVYADGADDGAYRIQGKNLRAAWCDEVGLWRRWDEAWNESLQFAVRLAPGRIVATGTPKQGNKLVRELVSDPAVPVSSMRTLDNAGNLDQGAIDYLLGKYAGTRLGRQELDGELLDDVPGALWTHSLLEQQRVTVAPLDLLRVVVGVDPKVSKDENANEAGIIVAAVDDTNRHGWVLADYSVDGGPEKWGRAVVSAYHNPAWKADRVVAETNQGGDLVRHLIHTIDKSVAYKAVHASRGKQARAEPVAALYEQGRVHHVGPFPQLEDEMTTWTPSPGVPSPNRMDALVWALTDLMVGPGEMKVFDRRAYSEPVVRRGDLVLRGERYVDKERR